MIRFAREEDLPRILQIYAPYILESTASFEYTVPTLEEFTLRFRQITAQFPWLVYEENGQVLGYAYGSLAFQRAAYHWSAESSVYLDPNAQGRGIGRRLYEVLEYLLQQQGYRKVYAIVTSENEGSLAFHKAVGYTFVAHMPQIGIKFDRLLGITWLEKCLKTGDLPSKFPKPIGAVVNIDRNFQ